MVNYYIIRFTESYLLWKHVIFMQIPEMEAKKAGKKTDTKILHLSTAYNMAYIFIEMDSDF